MQKRLYVLVVADRADVARLAERQIQHKHDVRIALGVPAAVTEIKRRTPDVLVCDEPMEPVSAEELFEIVSSFFPKIRRVLYTDSPAEKWKKLLARGVVDAVVQKPVTFEQLLTAIERA